jgi:hypothetical protein
VNGVSFSHSCRGARSVCVAIFFQEWLPPLVRTLLQLSEVKPNLWCGEIALSPGWCEYLFLVDGEWVPDLNAAKKCPDGAGEFISARWVEPFVYPTLIRPQPAPRAIRRRKGARPKSAAEP